jgi:hypothetical protein
LPGAAVTLSSELKGKQPMKDTIEIYVQPGKYGHHAGGRYPCQTYAAHKDSPETAAWRCALKHWFPSRPNGVILYSEAKAIVVTGITAHEFRATLTLPDKPGEGPKPKRDVQQTLITEDSALGDVARNALGSVITRAETRRATGNRKARDRRMRKERKK